MSFNSVRALEQTVHVKLGYQPHRAEKRGKLLVKILRLCSAFKPAADIGQRGCELHEQNCRKKIKLVLRQRRNALETIEIFKYAGLGQTSGAHVYHIPAQCG